MGGGGSANTSGGKGGLFEDVLNPISTISGALGREAGKKSIIDPFGIGTLDPMGDMNMQA